MANLNCNFHVYCILFVSSIPLGNLVADDPPTDGTPIIQKGAAFIYNYQAVTSESESKVRVFSPFPQPPEVDLSTAKSLIELLHDIKKYLLSLPFVAVVRADAPCPTTMATCQSRADSLREALEYRLQLLNDEQEAIARDYDELLRVASSFAPPPTATTHSTHHRSKRLVPASDGSFRSCWSRLG